MSKKYIISSDSKKKPHNKINVIIFYQSKNSKAFYRNCFETKKNMHINENQYQVSIKPIGEIESNNLCFLTPVIKFKSNAPKKILLFVNALSDASTICLNFCRQRRGNDSVIAAWRIRVVENNLNQYFTFSKVFYDMEENDFLYLKYYEALGEWIKEIEITLIRIGS